MSLFKDITDECWEELFNFSSYQGVKCIAFDGVQKTRLKPCDVVLMKWYGYSNLCKQIFESRKRGLKALSQVFEKAGVPFM